MTRIWRAFRISGGFELPGGGFEHLKPPLLGTPLGDIIGDADPQIF